MIAVACMPSTDQLYGRVEEMDNHVDQIFKCGKGNNYVRGLGDFNAVVGERCDGLNAGCFSLGGSNNRSDFPIKLCKCRNIMTGITWFDHNLIG